MPNRALGGFKYRGNREAPTAVEPRIEIYPVASAYATVLYWGDPVKLAADGTLQAAAPGDRVIGVFVGAERYWTGTEIKKGTSLPVSTWGTNLERQSLARVIRAKGNIFEVDCDDGVTATTQAGYEAFINENCEWATGTAIDQYSGAVLDISTHATTGTLSCRIVEVPNKTQQDFAASRVKVYIEFNLTQDVVPGIVTGS